jgi:FKBP-type peptidyl-prolyl cis-trans isomerase SlyD
MTISNEKVVSIHYVLKDDEGEEIDSSAGRDPLVYLQGAQNIIPGLEKALEGKAAGEKVHAVIAPEDAYGKKSDDLIKVVPLAEFPEADQVKVGVQFQIQSDNGVTLAIVTKVENDTATLDMNHDLADLTLHFDIDIVEVREASAEEISHGHVHGPGGHHH